VILGHKFREAFKWASFLFLIWDSFGKMRLFQGALGQGISDMEEPRLATSLLLPWNIAVVKY
jgi:hypothetical protein